MKVVLLGLILFCTHSHLRLPTLRPRAVTSIMPPPGAVTAFLIPAISGRSPAGTTVTCSTSLRRPVWQARAAATVDGTVSSGGTLTLTRATLTHSGELDVQHGGTINVKRLRPAGSGTLTIAPGSGATCETRFHHAGQGTPMLNHDRVGGNPGHNHYAVLYLQHGSCTEARPAAFTPPERRQQYPLELELLHSHRIRQRQHAGVESFSVVQPASRMDCSTRMATFDLTIGSCVNCNFVVQNVSFTNPVEDLSTPRSSSSTGRPPRPGARGRCRT